MHSPHASFRKLILRHGQCTKALGVRRPDDFFRLFEALEVDFVGKHNMKRARVGKELSSSFTETIWPNTAYDKCSNRILPSRLLALSAFNHRLVAGRYFAVETTK